MEIIETIFKVDRFYVKVKADDGRQRIFPRANFVWLQGNPSFVAIPAAYVIHHLDFDKTNDDISNLALMLKYHHVAYHWKRKTVVSPVIMIDKCHTSHIPNKLPSIYQKSENCFCVYFREGERGHSETVNIYSDEKGSFRTRERAQEFIDRIWPVRDVA